jgi:tetratricopeptide (TPR) repeat protein/transcriptional regulator with XRE-family HTH domain
MQPSVDSNGEVRLVPDGSTSTPLSRQELAAELRRLLAAAESRPGRPGQWKRSALARKLGVSVSSLYAYLDGTTLPPAGVLARLLEALGVAGAERQRLAGLRHSLASHRRSRPVPQRDDPDVSRQPPVRQLPMPPPMFTGRLRELAALEQAQDASTVVISAIDGMAGVGKTALAVYAGHQMADRYPDGQLFIDLHGFTGAVAPVEPSDALDRLLRALGVPGERIPADLDDRAALWRSVLAARRMLIVLDNAGSEAQVAPLLPGARGCLVLVTSRRRLPGLDATYPVSLDTLPLTDALAVFARAAGADRLAGQSGDSAAEAVELCGRLPLAIRIAAGRLRSHPTWGVVGLVERLRSEGRLLSELDDGTRGIAAALEVSTQHLPAGQQDMYRMLGLHPGPDIDPYAAAALAGCDVTGATWCLDQLYDAHLLQEPAAGRFVFHDLVRAHARGAATAGVDPMRRAALARLFDHYRYTASVAVRAAYPYEHDRGPDVPPAATPTPDLSDPARAIDWLDRELPNLLATALYAADHGWPTHVVDLSGLLRRHLRARGRYRDAQTLHHRALSTARTTGHQAGELVAHVGLGDVHRLQGGYPLAAHHYRQALHLARTADDRAGEVDALIGLSWVCRRQGEYVQAVDQYQRAWQLARATGHRAGEVDALTGIAQIHRLQGRYEQAAAHLEQALPIARATGHRPGELAALVGLGWIHRLQGRYQQATEQYGRALDLARSTGHRPGELASRIGLGQVHRVQGRYELATEQYERALHLARVTGHRPGEMEALSGLGQVERLRGRHDRAADHYRQLLGLARETGDRNGEFEARQGMGRLQHAIGQPEAALAHHRRALELATDLRQPADQAHAHDGLAHAHHALAQLDHARRHWQRALDILTGLGTDHSEDDQATTATVSARLAALPQAGDRSGPGPGQRRYPEPQNQGADADGAVKRRPYPVVGGPAAGGAD